MKREFLLAVLVVLPLLAGAAAPALAQDNSSREPYENETTSNETDGWMDDANDTSIDTISGMLGRVGTFVVGNNPSNPIVGPALTGMLVAGIMVGIVGSSRAGVVAGGTIGVATAAVLSSGMGMIPTWVYGLALILLGLAATAVGRRLLE